ncbi:MAG: TonB-dependent receptor [Fidelibacterota bacterium]|nr:MAG: TonB-dependent receptor [Candidatus Neomarinimicrobiota bacterium]
MIKRGFLTGLLVVFSLHWIYAGTTGKITGHVVSDEAGEALIGVNIIIQGTNLGAATDANGYYVILNVPPGIYDVTATAIGYANHTVQGVQVEIDLSTPLDFRMQTEVLAGEEVVVTAEVRVIKEDVAGSERRISSERIADLPTISLGDVVGLEAGVTEDFEIRGSQAEEVLFMIDGVTLRDARNSNPVTQIPLSAVNQISVQKGGVGAEYSNVRSGVVNVVTKEGDPTFYSGTFSIKYSPPAPKHFGRSPFDPDAFWLRPYLDPAVCWTGTDVGEPWDDLDGDGIVDAGEYNDLNGDGEHTVWDEYTQRQFRSFKGGWNGVSKATLSDDDPSNDLTPTAAQKLFKWEHRKQGDIDQHDYNVDAGFGGPVPFISRALGNLRFYASMRAVQEMYLVPTNQDALRESSWLLKVTSNLTPAMKLTVMGFQGETSGTSRAFFATPGTAYFTTEEQVARTLNQIGHTLSWRLYMNEYWSRININSNMQSAKLTHQLSPGTFYEFLVKRVSKVYAAGPGPARRDTSEFQMELIPGSGIYVDEAPVGFSPVPNFATGDGMGMGGSQSTYRDSSRFVTTTLRFDFSSQVTPRHEISTGLEFVADHFDTRYGTINKALPEGNQWIGISHDPVFAANPPFQRTPLRGTLYFEDKLETKEFVALLGLTAEYINPNGEWYDPAGPYDPNFYFASYSPELEDEFPTKKIKPQFYLSPRLGFSHPITVNSKLYFSYGHYRQLPFADALYRVQRGDGYQLNRIGDPNLPLEKTIAYELGYDQVLGSGILLHIAGYYKDISSQRSWTNYQGMSQKSYLQLENNSYEDIRGFEIDLSKTTGRWLTGNVNFEYRIRTYGYFGYANQYGTIYSYENPADNREFVRDNPLYQERPVPRPRFKTTLAIHTPPEFGPSVLGQRLLGGWLVNLLGRWTAGSWFTWNPTQIKGLEYNVQWKPYANVDLKASKTFTFGNLNATFFLDITNVFNFKYFNEGLGEGTSFFDKFDHDYYMYSLHLPEKVADKLGANYPNIPGDDQPGDVRDRGVEFVPIEWVPGAKDLPATPKSTLREMYYYIADTEEYMQYVDGEWVAASDSRIDEILDTKAYIDMPNQTYFMYLNPRDIFFGIRFSLDLK